MRLAISNIAWPSTLEDRAAALMRDAGVTGLEIAPTMVWPTPLDTDAAVIDAYREAWLARGVRIIALQALLFGRPELQLFGDASVRERMADHLQGMARLAAQLGAKALVFGSPGNRRRGSLEMEAALETAARFFGGLAGRLEDMGLVMTIEGNPAAYGCDFLTSTDDAAELVRRVDRPGVRLQLDTSTMAVNGEDYGRVIAEYLPLAAHVHLSEPNLAPFGAGSPHADGMGATGTDHEAVAAALRAAGHQGYVSVEMRMVAGDETLSAVAGALRAARERYRL